MRRVWIGMLILLCGCASIMHGTRQDIGISSNPSGAHVAIDNQPRGNTPMFADLSRKDNHIVKLELDGYLPYETTLTRSVSGWVLGNIVFGGFGLIGLAVDAISGGLYKLNPEQISGVLQQGQKSYLYKNDRIYIAVVLKTDPSWQKVGQLVPIGQ